MAKANPYLKYEPSVQTFEDVRFQIERLVRAINGIADSTGITAVKSSAGVSVLPGDGGGPILSVPDPVEPEVTQEDLIALEYKMKRYAHFASMD